MQKRNFLDSFSAGRYAEDCYRYITDLVAFLPHL